MTTPLLPDFILKLFQDEVKKIALVFIKKLCDIFDLDVEDAKKKLGDAMDIEFVFTDNPHLKIVKKQKEIDPSERCIAKVYNKDRLGIRQCTRRRKDEECRLCKKHMNMLQERKLKYGTIEDEEIKEPLEVLKKKVIKLKKYTIY
jgi:hypothetical protein